MLSVRPDSTAVEVLATFTLGLILFLDAVNLERTQEGRDLVAPLLALGPGTLLVVALGTAAAAWLLDLPLVLAGLVGAVLASTDPVVLRDVTRNAAIPASVRRALRIEAGANDIVVLPILLVLLAVARHHIAWFGPRGLSSLLFALLVAREGLPRGEELLAVVGIVVVASLVLHGASGRPLAALYVRAAASRTLGEERERTATGLFAGAGEEVPRITPEELAELIARPDPPLVLDVRTRSQRDEEQIPGSIRVRPDEVAQWARGRSVRRRVVTYCT